MSSRHSDEAVIVDPAEFDAALEVALGGGDEVIVLVVGANKPETGKSWCPDCVCVPGGAAAAARAV